MSATHLQTGSRSGEQMPELLVGVDGSIASGAAVRYALALAPVIKAPVRLIHCVPAYSPLPPLSLLIGDIALDTGQALLVGIAERARAAAPDVDVVTSLVSGLRGAEIVKAAKSAQLVILGRGAHHHDVPHLETGATAAGIATHAHCPVRVVPADWRPRVAATEVVVGIKDIAVSEDLVRRGFVLAERSGAAVVLLHAWHLPSGDEELVTDTDVALWTTRAAQNIAEAAKGVRSEFADVPFEIRIVHEKPALALLNASTCAGTMLIGRHSHRHPMGHLGSLPRALMSACHCPLEVGPEPAGPRAAIDLTLEARGAMLR